MIKTDNFEKIEIASPSELNAWLKENYMSDESFWLVTYKKDVPEKYVSVQEVLDELLCFGWIDGIRRKLDEQRTMQLISKRKTQHWAKTYKDRIAKLTAQSRMHQAGTKSVEAAKESGLWTFMDDVDALIAPRDLSKALENTFGAQENYEAYPPAYKRNVLRWLKLAKTDATRKKRIDKICETSAANTRIPQM